MNKISDLLSVENLNRVVVVLSGTFLISLGLYLFLNSNFGLTPFTVMINGLTNTFGLTFGQTSIIFKLSVIISFLLFTDKKFGVGTVINAVFVGVFVDLFDINFWQFYSRNSGCQGFSFIFSYNNCQYRNSSLCF